MPEIDCSHPYWGQSVQCRERQAKQQQKPQGKPEAKQQQPKSQGKPREKKPKPRDGFDDELANRHVRIVMVLGNGKAEEVSGTIVDVARYWYKVLDDGGAVKYINKAFIVSIIPQ